MSRSGYSDDCDDNLQLGRWRAAVKNAIMGKKGQAFLRELLAALDALPQKRLVANVLQVGERDEVSNEIVPVKNGDVCAFGAVGRARGIEMPADILSDPDDWDAAEEVQHLFGTTDALSREIMYVNDERGCGRRVPYPNVLRGGWDCFEWRYLPETPEERYVRVRAWVEKQIWEWKEIDE